MTESHFSGGCGIATTFANAQLYLRCLISQYHGKKPYARPVAYCEECILHALQQPHIKQLCVRVKKVSQVYKFQGYKFYPDPDSVFQVYRPCGLTCCSPEIIDLFDSAVVAAFSQVKVKEFAAGVEAAFKVSTPDDKKSFQLAAEVEKLKALAVKDADTIKQLQEAIKQYQVKILDLNNELAPYRAVKLITDSQELDDAQKRFKLLELD